MRKHWRVARTISVLLTFCKMWPRRPIRTWLSHRKHRRRLSSSRGQVAWAVWFTQYPKCTVPVWRVTTPAPRARAPSWIWALPQAWSQRAAVIPPGTPTGWARKVPPFWRTAMGTVKGRALSPGKTSTPSASWWRRLIRALLVCPLGCPSPAISARRYTVTKGPFEPITKPCTSASSISAKCQAVTRCSHRSAAETDTVRTQICTRAWLPRPATSNNKPKTSRCLLWFQEEKHPKNKVAELVSTISHKPGKMTWQYGLLRQEKHKASLLEVDTGVALPVNIFLSPPTPGKHGKAVSPRFVYMFSRRPLGLQTNWRE